MNTIVKDGKFSVIDTPDFTFAPVETETPESGIDIAADTDPRTIIKRVGNAPAIRIDFPTSHDGRGFSIASALRRSGYRGHLRAFGHVLADQYPLALRSGFDDVEITHELAARQPEKQWADALLLAKDTYREHLMRGANPATVRKSGRAA